MCRSTIIPTYDLIIIIQITTNGLVECWTVCGFNVISGILHFCWCIEFHHARTTSNTHTNIHYFYSMAVNALFFQVISKGNRSGFSWMRFLTNRKSEIISNRIEWIGSFVIHFFSVCFYSIEIAPTFPYKFTVHSSAICISQGICYFARKKSFDGFQFTLDLTPIVFEKYFFIFSC